MKKLKAIAWLVLMVLTCAGFAACSENDDDEDTNKDYAKMIIGTWSETGDDPYEDPGVYEYGNHGYTFYPNGKCIHFGSGLYTYRYEIVDDMVTFFGDYRDCFKIKSISKVKLVIIPYYNDEPLYSEEEVYYRVD